MKMKKIIKILGLVLLLGVGSCSKMPATFDIVGQWGVYDVTYIFPDLEPTHLEFTNNHYCEYWTFQVNGILSVKKNSTNKVDYGDYYYNSNSRKLKFIHDGYTHYLDADVAEVSPIEMILTVRFSYGGTTIYKMKKLEW